MALGVWPPRSASPSTSGPVPETAASGWPPRSGPPQSRAGLVHSQPQATHQMKGPLQRKGHFLEGRGSAELQDSVHPNPVHGQSSAATTSPLGGPLPCTNPGPPLLPPPHLFILHTSIRHLCVPQRGPWCLCCHQSSWDTLCFLSL